MAFLQSQSFIKKFFVPDKPLVAIQSLISLSGFYKIEATLPPRFALLLLPPVLFIFILFTSKKGKALIDGLDIKTLTYIHTIRIPVELVLLWLCTYRMVPELMTFEGRNFDILSGISAPVIYYLTFRKQKTSTALLLIWNLICLGLLLNIAGNAVLSLPTPFQQFALDQPNIALLQFPFTLLPAVLVPLVLLSHLASIRQIINHKQLP
ncbi:hypothetical protein [Flavobacterium kingsejongi]|uniref:hypothetical protein n=1 Tax=Flavobacterium kingsejongi TaxID=1678728 RepID=UPI001D131267|nr:hypothetical protein [Flavobacterium kingsejongi]